MKISSDYTSTSATKKPSKNNKKIASTYAQQTSSSDENQETSSIANIRPVVPFNILTYETYIEDQEAQKVIDSLLDKLSLLQKKLLIHDNNTDDLILEMETLVNFLHNNKIKNQNLVKISDEIINRCITQISLIKKK